MVIDTDTRPIRIDADEQSQARWFYRDHCIDVIYMDRLFWVRVRPFANNRILDMEKIMWPVQHYKTREEVAKCVNTLLSAACAAIDLNDYKPCRERSYTRDGVLLSFLQAVRHKVYKIRIQPAELAGVIEAGKVQLALI